MISHHTDFLRIVDLFIPKQKHHLPKYWESGKNRPNLAQIWQFWPKLVLDIDTAAAFRVVTKYLFSDSENLLNFPSPFRKGRGSIRESLNSYETKE